MAKLLITLDNRDVDLLIEGENVRVACLPLKVGVVEFKLDESAIEAFKIARDTKRILWCEQCQEKVMAKESKDHANCWQCETCGDVLRYIVQI